MTATPSLAARDVAAVLHPCTRVDPLFAKVGSAWDALATKAPAAGPMN